jgi:nitroimidazol reductase NimA-like FMN-containing flavoprotein (pyridoxamine 5'-phosphate oxidase superfamily)
MSYHVRRKDREIVDISELIEIIARNKYATLGLCYNNEPYVVTLTYGYDKNAKALYFHCSKEGLKLDFINKNPNVCLTIIEDNGFESKTCNHPYKSIIIRGKIEFINDIDQANEAIKLMIDQLEFEEREKAIGTLNQNNKFYQDLKMFKVEISEMTGKEKRSNT